MKEYDQKYAVTTEDGNVHIAFFRKGEDYDWWEEDKTFKEIKGVVFHHELDFELNEKQVRLVNWMFNY